MRLTILAALALVSCQGIRPGPAPAPTPGALEVRASVSAKGEGTVAPVTVAGTPLTQLVRWSGNATVTAIATLVPPHAVVYIDGDSNLVVEPVAGMEAYAIEAQRKGEIVIRRNGVVGNLNSPGSIGR